jgi:threonine synthase
MTRPEQVRVMKNDQGAVEQFVLSVSRAAKENAKANEGAAG